MFRVLTRNRLTLAVTLLAIPLAARLASCGPARETQPANPQARWRGAENGNPTVAGTSDRTAGKASANRRTGPHDEHATGDWAAAAQPNGAQYAAEGNLRPQKPAISQIPNAGQFTAQFGPTANDYQTLVTFAKAHGLTVTRQYDNRVVLDVSGTADQVNKAFYITLMEYKRPDGSSFHTPDREPSLDLKVPVLHISGLENYPRLVSG